MKVTTAPQQRFSVLEDPFSIRHINAAVQLSVKLNGLGTT